MRQLGREQSSFLTNVLILQAMFQNVSTPYWNWSHSFVQSRGYKNVHCTAAASNTTAGTSHNLENWVRGIIGHRLQCRIDAMKFLFLMPRSVRLWDTQSFIYLKISVVMISIIIIIIIIIIMYVGLTTLLPSVSRLSRQWGSLTSHNPIGLHGLLRG
jgi:hypothetical protein